MNNETRIDDTRSGDPPGAPPRRVVGLDVHPDTCEGAVLEVGRNAATARVRARHPDIPTPGLAAWAGENLDPERDLVVMESCNNSFELCAQLEAAGFGTLVLESAQVGRIADAFVDDDRIAAERIARAYLTGLAKVVWVPDAQTRERRALLAAYSGAVVDHTRATNEFKGHLTAQNLRLKKRNPAKPETREWVCKQLDPTPTGTVILEELYANIDRAAAARKRLYALICREMAGCEDMLGALRVLGIGVINAFAIVATVGDVRRFASPAKLVAYFGLNPGRKRSGAGKDIKTGVGNRGRSDMRNLLVQAAHSVMRKSSGSSPLAKWGWKLFARKGKRNIAVAAVARRLARILYHLLNGRAITLEEQRPGLERKLRMVCNKLTRDDREQLGLPAKTGEIVVSWMRSLGFRTQENMN